MVQNEKIELVARVADTLKKSQSIVLSDFKGMTVAQLTALRSQLREQSIEMRVIKNRLIKRALNEAGYDNLDEYLVGNTAVSFGIKDPVAPAKILTEYAKKNDKFIIKGGLLEGRRLDLNGVKSLAGMPNRKELLSIMAGDLKQPAAKMAMVFQAGLLKVAYAMKALASKQGATSESAA
jgi:large subunit ribosomal protein L10